MPISRGIVSPVQSERPEQPIRAADPDLFMHGPWRHIMSSVDYSHYSQCLKGALYKQHTCISSSTQNGYIMTITVGHFYQKKHMGSLWEVEL